MPRSKKPVTFTAQETETLERLRKFASDNELGLFNVRGSLYSRVNTITNRTNGKCPCLPDTRPHCPCNECIDEIKTKGECFCRVFTARK